jgi:DNA-binding XRE family transcriptional regulator
MNGTEFRERRERLLLTQSVVADRLKVSTATVRNWESEVSAVPAAVEALWDVWEDRFQQESPSFGPLTLVYSDGPMFIDPQGPRRPLAMMHQEPFVANAGALARVCALWGRQGFHSPLIMMPSGDFLWNANELAKVVDGSDTEAPTVPVLLRKLGAHARAYSSRYVRNGPRMPSFNETTTRQREIEAEADKLDALAAADTPTLADAKPVEDVLDKLRRLGMFLPDDLVSAVDGAYVVRGIPWPAPG